MSFRQKTSVREGFVATVVGKRRGEGFLFFGPYFYITVRFEENGTTREIGVPVEQYYAMDQGEQYKLFLYRHSDGLWYPQPQ